MHDVIFRTLRPYAVLFVLLGLSASLPWMGHAAADKAIVARTADADGARLHYLTAGRGEPVILLHGYTQTSRMWRPVIAVLAEKFMVIAPDLPGIGDSAIPNGDVDMTTAATRIRALAKSRLLYRRGVLSPHALARVERALLIALDLLPLS